MKSRAEQEKRDAATAIVQFNKDLNIKVSLSRP